ncbi:Hypothetical protein MVR_LOCUS176 [uncultured virus]|nr:Hypothetical protein MVR_LOCUS176 [uncultured virus]
MRVKIILVLPNQFAINDANTALVNSIKQLLVTSTDPLHYITHATQKRIKQQIYDILANDIKGSTTDASIEWPTELETTCTSIDKSKVNDGDYVQHVIDTNSIIINQMVNLIADASNQQGHYDTTSSYIMNNNYLDVFYGTKDAVADGNTTDTTNTTNTTNLNTLASILSLDQQAIFGKAIIINNQFDIDAVTNSHCVRMIDCSRHDIAKVILKRYLISAVVLTSSDGSVPIVTKYHYQHHNTLLKCLFDQELVDIKQVTVNIYGFNLVGYYDASSSVPNPIADKLFQVSCVVGRVVVISTTHEGNIYSNIGVKQFRLMIKFNEALGQLEDDQVSKAIEQYWNRNLILKYLNKQLGTTAPVGIKIDHN